MVSAKITFRTTMGWVETKLAKCKIPRCAGCLYRKVPRKPWRMKGVPNSI